MENYNYKITDWFTVLFHKFNYLVRIGMHCHAGFGQGMQQLLI